MADGIDDATRRLGLRELGVRADAQARRRARRRGLDVTHRADAPDFDHEVWMGLPPPVELDDC